MRLFKIKMLSTFFFIIGAISAQEVKFGKILKEELTEMSYQKDSSASAVVLYRRNKLTFDYTKSVGFRVITYVHERVKIYNKDGFDYATVIEDLDKNGSDEETLTGLKGYTYNLENGEIVEHKLKSSAVFSNSVNKYHNEKKFTMPNIKEGSVIEYKYKVISPFYYSIDEIALQYDIPIKQQEIHIATPEYFVFKPAVKGYLPLNPKYGSDSGKIDFVNKNRDGRGIVTKTTYSTNTVNYKIHTTDFVMNDVPALKEEPFVNDMDNYRSSINYELQYVQFPQSPRENYTSTWEKVIKTIYKGANFGKQLDQTNYFKDDLKTLLSGKTDDIEKASAIFHYVQQRMSWNKFRGFSTNKGVKKAYKEKSGNTADINLMLTAMLKKAGLEANPVLISTRDHGVPISPTIEGFNYVVASVAIDGNTIFLDATNKYTKPNLLPTRALNWFGKIVKEDKTFSTVSLFPTKASQKSNVLMVDIKDNGDIEGKIRKTYSDYRAYVFRNDVNGIDQEAYLEKLENEENGMEISNYTIKNDKTVGKPVVESFEFRMENQANTVGDKIYFSPMFNEALTENPFKLDDRKYPIDFVFPWQEKCIININIPEGYKVISKPANVSMTLQDQMGSFVFKIVESGNKLQIMVDLKMNKAVIPAGYYASVKELYKIIVEKETEKVVLSKIMGDEHTERTTDGR